MIENDDDPVYSSDYDYCDAAPGNSDLNSH